MTITGQALQGQTLTASNTLADADGIPASGANALSYQWYRGGVLVSSATGASYVLAQADVGAAISVVASYTDLGGTLERVSATATSAVVTNVATIFGANIFNGVLNAGQVVKNSSVNANGTLDLNGFISIADPDLGEAAFSAKVSVVGGVAFGDLSLTTDGQWAYRVRNSEVQSINSGDKAVDTFVVSSKDGSAKLEIRVMIVGVNNPVVPVLAIPIPLNLTPSTALTGGSSSSGLPTGVTASGMSAASEKTNFSDLGSKISGLDDTYPSEIALQKMPDSAFESAGKSGVFFRPVAPISDMSSLATLMSPLSSNWNAAGQSNQTYSGVESEENRPDSGVLPSVAPTSSTGEQLSAGLVPAEQNIPSEKSPLTDNPAIETPTDELKVQAEPSFMTPALGLAFLGATGLQNGRITWDKPKSAIRKRKTDKFSRTVRASLKQTT